MTWACRETATFDRCPEHDLRKPPSPEFRTGWYFRSIWDRCRTEKPSVRCLFLLTWPMTVGTACHADVPTRFSLSCFYKEWSELVLTLLLFNHDMPLSLNGFQLRQGLSQVASFFLLFIPEVMPCFRLNQCTHLSHEYQRVSFSDLSGTALCRYRF